MATPSRLVEVQCPSCRSTHWEIDSDYRGMDGAESPYGERSYKCPFCGVGQTGYRVKRKSPPAFLLQPHPMYPMSRSKFDYWVGVLRTSFPDHNRLRDLGARWSPQLPGQSEAPPVSLTIALFAGGALDLRDAALMLARRAANALRRSGAAA